MQRKQVRIAVLDIDETAYCSVSKRADKLSQPIIDRAKQGNYTGLYGCTHRSYSTLHECKGIALKIASTQPGFSYDEVINNFCTHKVMTRMAAATGLTLHAVSTADDIVYGTAGAAYDALIKPYEVTHDPARSSNPEDEIIHVSDTDKPHLTIRQTYDEWKTKNPQLTQIALHAKDIYPDAEIILDFYDDRMHLCEKACTVTTEESWPDGVSLNAFCYAYTNASITEVTPGKKSSLSSNSVFAGERKNESSTEETARLTWTP